MINEDRVAPHEGFGTHSHREFEIFSYIISGELEHTDSLGNTEILKCGSIQLTSAGTGIRHSEKTYGCKAVHFLQIWALPHTPHLKPSYFTRHFTDAEKTNTFVRVVAPVGSKGVIEERDGEGPAPVQSDLTMYASFVEGGQTVAQKLTGKKAYVHVVQTSGYNPGKASGATVRVRSSRGFENLEFKEGDGAYIAIMGGGGIEFLVQNTGEKRAEVVLFDLG